MLFRNLDADTFTFKVSLPDKPFTRRVLSVVNSVYDPLGLATPVLLEGKLLLQQLVSMGKKKNNDTPLGWDDPLPEALLQQWGRWRKSLFYKETGEAKDVECIRVDGASDEGPSHVEVQLLWADTHEAPNEGHPGDYKVKWG